MKNEIKPYKGEIKLYITHLHKKTMFGYKHINTSKEMQQWNGKKWVFIDEVHIKEFV